MIRENMRNGMPDIPNKALFAAVMWARRMVLEDRVLASVAFERAARYYQVPVGDVACGYLHVGACLKVRKSAISKRGARP